MTSPETGLALITLALLLVLYAQGLLLSRRVTRLERKMTFTGLVSQTLQQQKQTEKFHEYLRNQQTQTSKDQVP